MKIESNKYMIPFQTLVQYKDGKGSADPRIKPAVPYLAFLYQSSPTQNTWYTIADITAKGIAGHIAAIEAAAGITLEVRITVDGGTAVTMNNTGTNIIWGIGEAATANTIRLIKEIEFSTNLKVEARTTAAGKTTLQGFISYALEA